MIRVHKANLASGDTKECPVIDVVSFFFFNELGIPWRSRKIFNILQVAKSDLFLYGLMMMMNQMQELTSTETKIQYSRWALRIYLLDN